MKQYHPLRRFIEKNNRAAIIALFLSCMAISACERRESRDNNAIEATPTSAESLELGPTFPANLKKKGSQTLWVHINKALEESTDTSRQLEQSIGTLLDQPNENTLQNAQEKWLQCKYALDSLALFANIMGDNETLQRALTHPIQPGYLDRFGPYLYSGLVHDIGIDLSPKSLLQQHTFTDPSEVVLGIYAIEYMLFGELHKRSSDDYTRHSELDEKDRKRGLLSLQEIPNNRRRTLLELQISQLVKDIETVKASTPTLTKLWTEKPGGNQFLAVRRAAETLLTRIIANFPSIQPIDQDEKSSNTPQPTEHKTELNTEKTRHSNSTSFLIKLRSMKSILDYYSSAEKTAMKKIIDASIENIGEYQNIPQHNARIKALAAGHQNIKKLIQKISPTTE